nr:ribonuclease H-like domain-containing protein [Tanacetum cinerariifolium]
MLFSDPIESLSPQVVAAAKLPILNLNEFDLWKMRIKQYFLMTDYSLWEVILNGDFPTLTRVVDGVVQVVAPTTVEQRLAKNNELKARGTLLMALPDKHQLKFNIHKDAKSLIEAIEKSAKAPASILPNVDNLSDAIIYSFFANSHAYHESQEASSKDRKESRMTHPHTHRHVVPTSVLTRSRLVPLNAARPVTTVVPQTTMKNQRPVKHAVNNAPLPIRRPINHRPSPKHRNFYKTVTTAKVNKVNAVKGTKGNWAAFGGNPKGGKITGKCKRKTGKLDFYDVYFVKEIKFNLFSVSQMCEKKNNVLFTDTECVVLSFDFKLLDENHVFLRVPRENNMYNVDLKNVVPSRDLTGIKREFSVARTPQQNGVAERKNRTLNEAARTMLADSLLPIPFWTEAVNTACYVQNMADEGFLVGYSVSSKAFRVFNSRTRIVQETLYINFLENQPNVKGNGPTWLFDIDTLTQSMNYQPVVTGNQPNYNADPYNIDAGAAFDVKENDALLTAVRPNPTNITNSFNVASPSDNAVSITFEIGGKSSFVDPSQYPDDLDMPILEDIVYSDDEEDVGAEADFFNLETNIIISPIPTTRVHKDHPVTQFIGDLTSAPQTRIMARMVYVDDIIFGTTNKELCKAFEKLIKDKFQMSSMGELTFFLGLQVKQKDDVIFINQDKYVAKILKKFGLTDGKSASTPIDTEKPLLKNPNGKDVDVHIYSEYAGASFDRKSTTGGCQFLGYRLIYRQCKKQTVVATSSTEAEYVAVASCCAQVLWIQNQLLDYGPPIYVSCIKHFCALIMVKKTNDVVRLQALIDRKKVVITEDTI